MFYSVPLESIRCYTICARAALHTIPGYIWMWLELCARAKIEWYTDRKYLTQMESNIVVNEIAPRVFSNDDKDDIVDNNNGMKETPSNETPFCNKDLSCSIFFSFSPQTICFGCGRVSERFYGSRLGTERRTPENRLYIYFILITSPRFSNQRNSASPTISLKLSPNWILRSQRLWQHKIHVYV